ncbi:hypothetical protein ACQEWB_40865 [Streptomyces sp. CA-249302]|uniref:hypothetical protein n=1 Tax=Streptomyces sp. CA-249302 TaxID=3240058 RepID=UPI003D8BE249
MDRYFNQGKLGWTELRVHGVSGTPSESELGHPAVRLVAGDKQAGFYRRFWESRAGAPDNPEFRREGYSWGGLTSGDNSRALWLLLLPFMLLNLAHYMDPGHHVKDDRAQVVRERSWLQRLLALSLTGTYVLAATSVSMDLVAWQCGRGGQRQPACRGSGIWLGWLHYTWLGSTGRHLAVAALVPLALIGVLWWLANKTWAGLESRQVPQIEGEPSIQLLLEDRQLWNGRGPVRQLRALHVMAALALVGVLVLAPLLPAGDITELRAGDTWHLWTPFLRNLLLGLLLLVLLVVVVCTAVLGGRQTPKESDVSLPADRPYILVSRWVVLVLVAGALTVAFWGSADGNTAPASAELPWQVPATRGLLIAQGSLLSALVISHAVRTLLKTLASRKEEKRRDPAPPFDNPCFPRPAWGGMTMTGVALLATALATGLAAGVTLRMAEMLGAPTVPGHGTGGQRPLVVPTAYFWAAVCALAFTAVALVVGVVLWCRIRRSRADFVLRVEGAYPWREITKDTSRKRGNGIAHDWALAQGLDRAAATGLGLLIMAATAITVTGIALDLAYGTRLVTDGARWLTTTANLVLTGLVLALLWAGRQAYRSPSFRRTVGVLWDIGTFWPRATHPFAPPCYAERTVPDLLQRLEYLTDPEPKPEPGSQGKPDDRGQVILSCHSQGTVIGAAVLMQAKTVASARTCFLTYGCPLTRLYVRFFPAYFNAKTLDRLGQILANTGGNLPEPKKTPKIEEGTRWRNLYRLSDPIGGWIVHDVSLPQPSANPLDVLDRQLLDPAHFAKQAGDPSFQRPLGHSDYFADDAFDDCVNCCREPNPPCSHTHQGQGIARARGCRHKATAPPATDVSPR